MSGDREISGNRIGLRRTIAGQDDRYPCLQRAILILSGHFSQISQLASQGFCKVVVVRFSLEAVSREAHRFFYLCYASKIFDAGIFPQLIIAEPQEKETSKMKHFCRGGRNGGSCDSRSGLVACATPDNWVAHGAIFNTASNLEHDNQERGCRTHLNGEKSQQRQIAVAVHITTEEILKKQVLGIVATLSLLIPMSIIGFAALNARVRADIPFDFMVGGKQFQAGKYVVERLYVNDGANRLIIRGVENGTVANFNVNDVTSKGEPQTRLVFRRYGNQRFLAQIYDGLSNQGQELMKSKAEREAAKKLDTITQNSLKPETETVVARVGQ